MHDHELNRTSSKRTGVKIRDDQLPGDYDRRILVTGNGNFSFPYFSKRSEELLDYFVDMMKWLEPNEEVIGVVVWTAPKDLLVTRVEYASTGVVIWLVNGGNNVHQKVFAQVATSLGKIKMVQFVVHTCGHPNELAIVAGEGDHVAVGSNIDFPLMEHGPKFKAYPERLDFLNGGPEQAVIITNEGNDAGSIYSIKMNGKFAQRNNGTQRFEPGEAALLMVSYKPDHTGAHNGSIRIDVGGTADLLVSLHGQYA